MGYLDLLISGILFFIMLNVGLSLNARAFVVTLAHPKAFVVGLSLQMIFLPLMAFVLVKMSSLPYAFKMGILILSACPGGMTSNFISYLINANAALSIAMTVTNSFLGLLTVPLVINLALAHFMQEGALVQLSFWDTVRQIFMITIVPVFIGMLIRRQRADWAARVEQQLKWITILMLAVLFLIKFFAGQEHGGAGMSTEEVLLIFPYALLVNILGMSSGFIFGKMLGLSVDDQATIGIEVGIQNTSLAFLIAGTFLHNEDMLKPALVYAMFTFFTAVGFGLLMKPHEARRLWQSIIHRSATPR